MSCYDTIRFVPQRNGVRPSVVVSVRRGVCLKNTNNGSTIKKYLCLGAETLRRAPTLIYGGERGRRCVHRVLDALKDNNYSVSLPTIQGRLRSVKDSGSHRNPRFPRRAATRISSSTQQVL
jgi:hypothetical protein